MVGSRENAGLISQRLLSSAPCLSPFCVNHVFVRFEAPHFVSNLLFCPLRRFVFPIKSGTVPALRIEMLRVVIWSRVLSPHESGTTPAFLFLFDCSSVSCRLSIMVGCVALIFAGFHEFECPFSVELACLWKNHAFLLSWRCSHLPTGGSND